MAKIFSNRTTASAVGALILFGMTATALPVFALNSGITYHGRILQADGVTPVSGSFLFDMQIRSADGSGCLMYEEQQTVSFISTDGIFAITINDGSGTRIDTTGISLDTGFLRLLHNAIGRNGS